MRSQLVILCMLSSAVAGLMGCVSAPSIKQQQEAYYGDYPEEYKDIITNYMSQLLKDPSSATYNYNGIPMKTWSGGGIHPVLYGYGICVLINAKNSFGAYTGATKFFFLIQDGNVIRTDNFSFNTEKLCPGSW